MTTFLDRGDDQRPNLRGMGVSGRRHSPGVEGCGGCPSKAMTRRPEAVVEVDPRYFRPTEVNQLVGDLSKAHAKLGWRPQISCASWCAKWYTRT